MKKAVRLKTKWLWILVASAFLCMAIGNARADGKKLPYGVMRPDKETRLKWLKDYQEAPKALIDRKLSVPLTGSFSLLPHLDYNPAQRNQGGCGNCWAWAGTGAMTIDLDMQANIAKRLSVQYNNSCGTSVGSFGCCGGWLTDLVDFYSKDAYGRAIAWSNSNAAWQDGGTSCAAGTSARACASIGTSTNYPIDYIGEVSIETHGVDQATAIGNIKNVLNQGKAVFFGFFMPTEADGDNFINFWLNQGESASWNPDYSIGHTWANGWGHAVLCVGYNDDDPDHRYWIMVNSWGTADGGRPKGVFHMDMDMDYDGYFNDGSAYGNFYWEALEIMWNVDSAAACACDLNQDGKCNVLDWPAFMKDWGRTDCPPPAAGATDSCACDLNQDGKCDMLDWPAFIADWGRTDCPVP